MSNIDKHALRMRNYLNTAVISGVKLLHLTTDELSGLLDELEAKDRRIEEEIGRANREHHRGFMMACGHLKEHANVHYADAAEMEMAALRQRIAELRESNVGLAQESFTHQQRIAELEARAVKLPATKFCPAEYAGSQLWEEVEIWNKAIEACDAAIRAAGIGKGE